MPSSAMRASSRTSTPRPTSPAAAATRSANSAGVSTLAGSLASPRVSSRTRRSRGRGGPRRRALHGPFRRDDDHARQRRRLGAFARPVDGAVEIRSRQPIGDRLRRRDGVGRAADQKPTRRRAKPPRGVAADEATRRQRSGVRSAASPAPTSAMRRAWHPVHHRRGEHIEQPPPKLGRRACAGDLATRDCVDPRDVRQRIVRSGTGTNSTSTAIVVASAATP